MLLRIHIFVEAFIRSEKNRQFFLKTVVFNLNNNGTDSIADLNDQVASPFLNFSEAFFRFELFFVSLNMLGLCCQFSAVQIKDTSFYGNFSKSSLEHNAKIVTSCYL